jgi:membrane-bound lytic murein transglycosylase A
MLLAGTPAAGVCADTVDAVDSTNKEIPWKIRVVKSKTVARSRAARPAKPAKTAIAEKGVAPWYRPVKFADVPGWVNDDHLAAFKTFLKSCERVVASSREREPGDAKGPRPPPTGLVAVCRQALSAASETVDKERARAFFEANFTANAVLKKGPVGMLTGYYEPLLEGSRVQEGRYQTPIYKRPPDLVNVVDDTRRGVLKAGALTHVRKTETGTEPYFTRAQIETGALKGKDLELLYFADPVEVFFMHIQGSGRVRLTDGSTVRVHYDGKNGHPYSSIGRYLTEKSILAADRISMTALQAWLRADPERGKQVMWQNTSYVFFREIKDDTGAPLGAMRVPLTAMRSLAIDPAYHALGTPVFINVPTMKHVPKAVPFSRLMVGQDVGSAIRGPERGDIYFGSGEAAGKLASVTRHQGRFFVLVPNAPSDQPSPPDQAPPPATAQPAADPTQQKAAQ